ncbi:MAG: tRNA (adenosine(37)-N6)-threonylcarbamoyltransferase complex dimerization subunit type 1 TsaB [Planctomycetaceae bacterium]|nr:tRNA (adenosine(37)-N6)-threonylcarbamoyltransferase complex dimerization subunit type 1 TsaB [Planctomycetaceae bacterium]
MWTLGLETSTRRGSVAIWDGEGLPLEHSLGAQSQKHATTLFQVLDELLKENGLQPNDLERVAVSIGPGSFTGLRIGIVAAKTLAYSLGCEVKPIETFLAVAQKAPTDISRVSVIGDAQRGDLFVGDFVRDESEFWQSAGKIRIVSAEEFAKSLSGSEYLCGPGLSRYSAQLQCSKDVLDNSRLYPSAGAVCELAVREDLPVGDCWSLQPLYLRKSSAEEKWDLKHS